MGIAAIIVRLEGVGYACDSSFTIDFDVGPSKSVLGGRDTPIEIQNMGMRKIRVVEGDFCSNWVEINIVDGEVYDLFVSPSGSMTSVWLKSIFGGASALDIRISRRD